MEMSVGYEEHLDSAGTGSYYNEGEADIMATYFFSNLCRFLMNMTGICNAIVLLMAYVSCCPVMVFIGRKSRLDEFPEEVGFDLATIVSFQGVKLNSYYHIIGLAAYIRVSTLPLLCFDGSFFREIGACFMLQLLSVLHS
ncbi:hypothetical protein LIER_24745 [Lithospermum erythrorhizon]|uniref:Amino acid transporter transmembrane domain-containing protein n=1 Tax=Lithospermum erythrorhizon TaxID=34254 RepID=A0AAV3R2D3_LITER